MIHPIRIIAIIVCSFMPIIISYALYNSFDCTTLSDNNYKAWLEQGNKGTFSDMINSCNMFHPIILAVLIPASPILAFTTYWMTRPENFSTESQDSNLESKK